MLIVYSTPVCHKCKVLKGKLTRANVVFKEVNLWEDDEASNFIQASGRRELPQVYKESGDELVYIGTDVEV